MKTYMFKFERNGMSKESPIIRAENLEAAADQISSETEEQWIVTSLTENGTAVPKEQWPKTLK
jgi:hypothetical protein